ncbi:sulfite exporter TauE/SafE family protein [Glycomyces sp. TRM65418]|uniref:sulfite exporter TauE/SafE family protein n=1 Tax=Glycomyces sp. TRM65418 TaxID=2867006 RepID=UPI001CE5ACAC|nr:sulfite exporter TauE/SafE family protein [Glycomyces sp. TRM65418]MCC3763419.1 sulfite exporter TauE/SafE family protein [Glycomyces sp. TRM65418]QZD57410.1 sulfite exporter TauE/SafE family protein [Glycomyces sp. TRM65418]
MTELPSDPISWAALALAAALVGFSKTGINGTASLSILLFATMLPAKESTGALLPVLILGDLFAIRFYSRHVEWRILGRLAPWVVVGVAGGAAALWFADDATMRVLIGSILLAMLALQVWSRLRPKFGKGPAEPKPPTGLARKSAAAGAGIAAGAATMTANAAGPVMVLYLMLSGFPKLRFLGTMAWFFFAVNLFKVPISVGLGLITWHTLLMALLLVPAVAVGALAGRAVVHRVDQRQFEIATLVLSGAGAALLIV